jgi:regulator of replication initiation timing
MTMQDMAQMKQTLQEQVQESGRVQITAEIDRLRDKHGEETFNKHIPAMQKLADQNPNMSPTQAFKIAAFDDLNSGQNDKSKALEAERKQRAASANFGSERSTTAKSGKMTQDDLSKLSSRGSGKPSPRFAAILAEERAKG